MKALFCLIFFFGIFFNTAVQAQVDCSDEANADHPDCYEYDPDGVPLDNGVVFLIGIGAIYAIIKMREEKVNEVIK